MFVSINKSNDDDGDDGDDDRVHGVSFLSPAVLEYSEALTDLQKYNCGKNFQFIYSLG